MFMSNFTDNLFNDQQKLWIFSKIKEFYKTDLYLSHVDKDFILAPLAHSLFNSTSLDDLYQQIAKHDYENGLSILRKVKNKTTYDYPSLMFQVRSLVELWPKMYDLYSNGNNNLKKFDTQDFGHKPNLLNKDDFNQVSISDIRTNSFFKKPFQEQYAGFQDSVVSFSSEVVMHDKLRTSLLIQTDIESFFHSLDIDELNSFLDKKISPNIYQSYLQQLKSRFKFKTLPIGWMYSGFIADVLLSEMHDSVQKKLNEMFRQDLGENLKKYIDSNVPAVKLNEDLIKKLDTMVKTSQIRFEKAFNYVDDFVFVLSYQNLPDTDVDEFFLDIFHKVVGSSLIDCANKILSETYGFEKRLRFYTLDEHKAKILYFDQSTINALQSNFQRMIGKSNYSSNEPNLWARLDDFLLPMDNDLSLNERNQFFAHINNIKNLLIEGRDIPTADRDDIFQKIILKLEKNGARYIYSVFSLLEGFITSDHENKDFYLKKINDIVDLFISKDQPLDIWLKLFKGYFYLYSRHNFDEDIQFFHHFQKFFLNRKSVISKCLSKQSKNVDDLDLLRSVWASYSLKVQLRKNEQVDSLVPKPALSKIKGKLSQYFKYLLLTKNFSRVKFLNNHDVYSFARVVNRLSLSENSWNTKNYRIALRNIKQKLSVKESDFFFRLTILDVAPKEARETKLKLVKNFNSLGVISSSLAEDYFRLDKSIQDLTNEIGDSYLQRLKFFRKEMDQDRIRFIPSSIGYSGWDNAKAVAFILSCLDQNHNSDIERRFLFVLSGFFAVRFVDYVVMPTANRSSGTFVTDALRILSKTEIREDGLIKDVELFRRRIKFILKKEFLFFQGTSQLSKYKAENVTRIHLDRLNNRYGFKKEVKERIRVTVAPINYKWGDTFDDKRGMKFKTNNAVQERLDYKIQAAIEEARRQKSSFLVIPELTLPRKYLQMYLRQCARHNIILVAGLEYENFDKTNMINSTIISFPVDRKKNPYSRDYIAFEQIKHFPAAKERTSLQKNKFEYYAGNNLFIFKSKKLCNFSVLTCSDFLSLRLRLKLQEIIQLLFVPAQNPDGTSYDHIAESSMRDLHCYTVICNNQSLGGSFIYGPMYAKRNRVSLKIEGKIVPEFATVEIAPNFLFKSQKEDSQVPFRAGEDTGYVKEKNFDEIEIKDLKQTPPDWGYPKKVSGT
jgi:hypothetical protein